METARVEAIVLRTDNFGDADRVVTLFTRELGKVEANAYGCRRVPIHFNGGNHFDGGDNGRDKIKWTRQELRR